MELDLLIERAAQFSDITVAVAAAEDEEVLGAVNEAIKRKLSHFLLFGDKEKILDIIRKKYPEIANNEKLEIIHAPLSQQAAESAVKAVNENRANVLMKGNIPTALILKTILNKDYGLRTGNVLSQVAVFGIPNFDRLIMITDSAMNLNPDLQQKVQIINNSVQIAKGIGIKNPLVAPIAAIELVNPAMEATVDAALLTQMNRRGQIKDCIVDGPLGFDNAVSPIAAEHKGIKSEVAGHADILLVPTIEVGNTLYKSLTYFAKAQVGSVIAGARAPIVLTSRADSTESKFFSLALAICSVNQ